MNYLKQALIELLSGLTTRKNEKEIWTTSEYGLPITIEPIDEDGYILREYYKNGKLRYEEQIKNDILYACKGFLYNGQLLYEKTWENGSAK